MTKYSNKSQNTLYLHSVANNDFLNELIYHIEKNKTNSTIIYLSKKNCRTNQSKILKYLDSYSIDAIVNFLPVNSCLDLNFLSKIKSDYDVKLICFQADVPEYFDSYYVYISQFYDLVLVDDYSELQRYKNYGFNATEFFQGVSKEYLVDPDTKRDIDISFVGRIDRPGRSQLFSFLFDKGYSLSLFGYGTKNGYISSKKMMEIYGRSKIVLNLTNVSTNMPFCNSNRTINNRIRQSKGRIWEGMTSGALVLTEPASALSVIGVNGEDFVIFNSFDELVKNIDYYLNSPKNRIAIAKSGFERALTKATYESRVDYLDSLIEKVTISKLGKIYVDHIYHKFISQLISYNYINSLIHFKKLDISILYGKRIDLLIYEFLRALIYYPYKKISKKLKKDLTKINY